MTKAAHRDLIRIILGCSLLLGTSAAFAANSDPDWKEFLVPEFGTRVQYPAGIFSVLLGTSEVGTGQRLSTPDERASLTIYARAKRSRRNAGQLFAQESADAGRDHPVSADHALLLRHLRGTRRNDLLQPL